MKILPQHKVALSALLALRNANDNSEFLFDRNTLEFTVDGKFIIAHEYDFGSMYQIDLDDILLLQKAKVQLPEVGYYVLGDKIKSAGALAFESLKGPAGFAFQNLVVFSTVEDAERALALATKLQELTAPAPTSDVKIRMVKTSPDAKEPRCAYNGTSAAFDIASIETMTIPAMTDAVVPVGIQFSISDDQPYYMTIHMRSSMGFKKGLLNHIGIVDAGYCGDFGVKVMNKTGLPVTIEKGEYFAQVCIHKKPKFVFEELSLEQWEEYEKTQTRGANGFGSSGK